MHDEVRQKKLAVYLFIGVSAAGIAGFCVTNFIQAAQTGAGTGFGDTVVVTDRPSEFFQREDVPANSR